MLTSEKIVRKLEENREKIEHFGVKKIGLFGSYIKNKQKTGSDIDILVIMNITESSPRVAAKISVIAKPRYVPMDILVRTPAEIEKRIKMGDWFIKRIISRGKVLYERRAN